MSNPDFEPDGKSEAGWLRPEQVRDCRSAISKLWGILDDDQKGLIWEGLDDGETMQLVESLPEPPADELEALKRVGDRVVYEDRPWRELKPGDIVILKESSEFIELRRRHAQELAQLVSKLRGMPRVFHEGQDN